MLHSYRINFIYNSISLFIYAVAFDVLRCSISISSSVLQLMQLITDYIKYEIYIRYHFNKDINEYKYN